MSKIKVIIIDDEDAGINFLKGMLESFCPEVFILGTANSISSGVEMINDLSPDLVFLDVNLPGGTGFDILKQTEQLDFDVIFTTAHDQYSLKAIKFSALDYLLKPIDGDDLVDAVNKYLDKKKTQSASNVQFLLDNLRESDNLNTIALPTMEGFIFSKLSEIVRLEGERAYTKVVYRSGEVTVVSRNLKHMEDVLAESGFCRVHKSHLVNLRHVAKYVKGVAGYVLMVDGSKVDISKNRKDDFLNYFLK